MGSNFRPKNLIFDYRHAYAAAHGRDAPEVEYIKGWYVLCGNKYRRNKFEQMRDRLYRRAADKGIPPFVALSSALRAHE